MKRYRANKTKLIQLIDDRMCVRDMKKLWTTNVGSHVWNMNRPDSDIDLFTAYIVPTTDILSGKNRGHGSHNYQCEGEDHVSHEIGKIVHELIKGNVNFLVGTLSDIILYQQNNYLQRLVKLVNEHGQTKACTHSIRGLATHNYRKYIENCNTDKKELLITKKCNTINRMLLFGINVLEGNSFKFTPVSDQTPADVKEMLDRFDDVVLNSSIPEKTNAEPFQDYLLEVRLNELRGLIV